AMQTRCGLAVETMTAAVDEQRLTGLLASADWVVDALFGSGLKGEIRPPFDRIIALINASGKRVLAVDVPSGLDADPGRPPRVAIRAMHTAAVAGTRVGFAHEHARPYVGEVHVIDLGVPPRVLAAAV